MTTARTEMREDLIKIFPSLIPDVSTACAKRKVIPKKHNCLHEVHGHCAASTVAAGRNATCLLAT
jgi:hypothetical protein